MEKLFEGNYLGIYFERVICRFISAEKAYFSPEMFCAQLIHQASCLIEKSKSIVLASVLVPALRGETPSNVLIYGKTGTGKTAVAKYVGKELEEAGFGDMKCAVIYINCEVVDTQYRILAHLARHFDKEIPMTGWPTDQVYAEFRNALGRRETSSSYNA